jgi:hypothetical protein
MKDAQSRTSVVRSIARRALTVALLGGAVFAQPLGAQEPVTTRTPATPLIAHDPYFSIWSLADTTTEQSTRHWTGTDQPMTGWLSVDGKALRFMGRGWRCDAADVARADADADHL